MGTVIHRDKTFEHNGVIYWLIYGGTGWGWSICDESGVLVDDGFFTLREVRAEVAKWR